MSPLRALVQARAEDPLCLHTKSGSGWLTLGLRLAGSSGIFPGPPKVTKVPSECKEATTCPNSNERFAAGEWFVTIEWYERASRHTRDDNTFGARPERGEYMVPVLVLRGGGKVLPITLSPVGGAGAGRPRRGGGAAAQHQVFSLASETADAILAKIETEFRDDVASLSV